MVTQYPKISYGWNIPHRVLIHSPVWFIADAFFWTSQPTHVDLLLNDDEISNSSTKSSKVGTTKWSHCETNSTLW